MNQLTMKNKIWLTANKTVPVFQYHTHENHQVTAIPHGFPLSHTSHLPIRKHGPCGLSQYLYLHVLGDTLGHPYLQLLCASLQVLTGFNNDTLLPQIYHQ